MSATLFFSPIKSVLSFSRIVLSLLGFDPFVFIVTSQNGIFVEINFAAEISVLCVGCYKATAIGTCIFLCFVIKKFDIFAM